MFANLMPIIASSELEVIIVRAVVPIATSPEPSAATALSKSCAIPYLYHSATDIAITKPALTPLDVAHSGAVAPAFICRTWSAEPFPNLAGVLFAEAYKISPAVVSVMSIVLLAGNVQNTSIVPALKSTALSLLELEITDLPVKVSGDASVIVPSPTSHSFALWCAIA